MKKLLLLLILFSVGLTQAQIVNIPNTYFKEKLLEASPTNEIAKDLNGNFFKIDANDDGEIQVSEALQTSYLDVRTHFSIDQPQNLIGIEAFINLEYLDCSQSSLGSLSLNQNINLKYLKCSMAGPGYSQIDLDVSQNVNLETLITAELTTSLDVSHMPNLEELRFTYENQSQLDVSNNLNLRILYCGDSALTSLDLYSNINLEELICHRNLLESLDLPQSIYLNRVVCSNNLLTEIDVSQNIGLINFAGHTNNFTNLDFSNNENLTNLTLTANDLNTLNIKNGSIESFLYINDNPNLLFVCADEVQVASVIAQVDSNTVVSSYCTFVPGGNYNTILGTAIFDFDNNGCVATDLSALNVRIDIDDGSQQGATFVNSSGDYTFYTQEGDFILTPSIENPSWFTFSPETVTIPFADADNNTIVQDFCVTANGIHNDLEIVLIPIVHSQPGFDAEYQIVYRNKGNQMLSGNINFSFDDDVLDIISSTIPVNVQTVGNLTWNYTNLVPYETRSINLTLNVNSPMETPPINIDDILSFSVNISPLSGDETPDDNEFEFNETVVGSYDPNDITCLEGDMVNPSEIGEYLHYNINFENTGTAAATFVVVKDEIDSTQYDISTLQILYASHDMYATINGDIVEFIFEDINLGPNEKGNVLFKLKTKNTLSTGDTVTNKADIYFDYNFPIETNDANTTYQSLSVLEFDENKITVFPNPTSSIININANTLIKTTEVYDLKGVLILSVNVNEHNPKVDLSAFVSGVYFVKLKTKFGESIQKVVKH